MKKALSLKAYFGLLPVLLLWAICGSFQRTFSEAQASPGPGSEKKQIVHPEVPRMPALEVKALLEKKGEIAVVDVNPPDYFKLWHIPGAVNIPYTMADLAKREKKLKTLPKNTLIVLYCLCEEGADSSEMALELRRLDYRRDKVKVLEGGLTQWDAKGYPMYRQKKDK